MAGNAEVHVSVEIIVHDGLAKLAQAVWDEYGVRILSAQVVWEDVSTLEEQRMKVAGVRLRTQTGQ